MDNIWLSKSQLWSITLAGRQGGRLDVNDCTSYDPKFTESVGTRLGPKDCPSI